MGAFLLPGIFLTVPAGLMARRFGDRPMLRGAFVLLSLGIALLISTHPMHKTMVERFHTLKALARGEKPA